MCIGEFGVVADVLADDRALVRFEDGSVRPVSLVVPIVEGIEIVAGDRVMVSMGLVVRREAPSSATAVGSP